MKTFLHLIVAIVIISTFSNCEKGFNLERTNPNDSLSDGFVAVKKLSFSKYEIKCRQPHGSVQYADPVTIKSGDHIWLQVEMSNDCNYDINGIRATITSGNNLATIVAPNSGWFIKFTNSFNPNNDLIAANTKGIGSIDNGTFFYMNTPSSIYNDYSLYAIEFNVSTSAVAGNQLVFNIETSDNASNHWSSSFSIIVQ